ncbi:hypothetical protein L208DRAFT_1349767, partial [Tricholoma matsutake]
ARSTVYMHTNDNQVQYFTTFIGKGGERKFKSCGLQTFRVGDIVQVQVSFIGIPVQGNNHKMLVVLHSIALLDNSLTKVHLPLIPIIKANKHLQATPNSNMTLADTKVKQLHALK